MLNVKPDYPIALIMIYFLIINQINIMPIGDQTGGGQQRSGGRGLGPAGSSICVCPKCGYKDMHKRGIPCNQVACPKCGTNMKGEHC